jgi:hypothetical protein
LNHPFPNLQFSYPLTLHTFPENFQLWLCFATLALEISQKKLHLCVGSGNPQWQRTILLPSYFHKR